MLRYDASRVLEDLLSIVDRLAIDVLMPAGLPGYELICRHRATLERGVRAPFNDLATFMQLADKWAAIELAGELEIPHPRTVLVTGPHALNKIARDLTYPVVFKSTVDQGTVRYAHDIGDLRAIAEAFWYSERRSTEPPPPVVAQEYVGGTAHGYYALADEGHVIAHFMHRRLHEVPASGGPSSMAVSYRDPELIRLGERMVAATRWTGVLMVEFKRARRDGKYYLIEVNPKFWGSLDLSIAAGVDFPWLLYEMLASDRTPAKPPDYRDGYVFRWLGLDLAYAVETRTLGSYFRTFASRRVRDDFTPHDPLPFFALLGGGAVRQIRTSLGRKRNAKAAT